jgi:hypothetical protein
MPPSMTAPAWAYVEVHPDERAATCARFLARAAAFFAARGSASSR